MLVTTHQRKRWNMISLSQMKIRFRSNRTDQTQQTVDEWGIPSLTCWGLEG
jgi:hypothetical protein